PHAMAYAIAGRVRDYRPPGYSGVLVPHGIAVAISAPAVFRMTGATSPERHVEAAALLAGETRGANPADAGEVLAHAVSGGVRATAIPNGIAGVGYTPGDVASLVDGAAPQQRLLANAPCPIARPELAALFEHALEYW